MTDDASNNQQLIDDIQSLQKMEQELFNNLETNNTLTPEQQQKYIEKINQLSNMRINLYKTLSGVNVFFQNALSSSVGTLKEQSTAISIVENELNQSKRRLEALEAERNNKIRLVEINDYYSDKYAEHSQLMKIIIFTLVPVILLVIIKNTGLLPNFIYYILITIISFIGAYFFWRRYASIIMRDNMNYQEYDWQMNASSLPTSTSTVSASDPWKSSSMYATCVGEKCCSNGMTWDPTIGQCVISSTVANASTTDASTTTSTVANASTTDASTVESFINNVLTKKQIGKYKDDYNMGNIQHPMSKSFVNKF